MEGMTVALIFYYYCCLQRQLSDDEGGVTVQTYPPPNMSLDTFGGVYFAWYSSFGSSKI